MLFSWLMENKYAFWGTRHTLKNVLANGIGLRPTLGLKIHKSKFAIAMTSSLRQTVDDLWKEAGLKCGGGGIHVFVCVCACVCVLQRLAVLHKSILKLCAFLQQATPIAMLTFCQLAQTVNQPSFWLMTSLCSKSCASLWIHLEIMCLLAIGPSHCHTPL